LTQISEELEANRRSVDQQQLQEGQITQQADLEASQRKEERQFNRQLEEDMYREGRKLDEQFEEQKKLVCRETNERCC